MEYLKLITKIIPEFPRYAVTENGYVISLPDGKKQWKMLYEKLPEVYAERARVEREFRIYFKKDVHFFKDETLEQFRNRIEKRQLGRYYE